MNPPKKTSEILAEKHGVSAPTIKRDGKLANSVESLKQVQPDIEQRVMAGEVNRQQLIEAVKKPDEASKILSSRPHVSNNSGNNEWYTPPEFIEAARKTMGGIDIDPASNDIAQQNVKASVYYTEETNGLDKQWIGNVWMNPPYSSALIGQFCERLVAEHQSGRVKQAVILVNNATEAKWFSTLASVASMVGFTFKRVRFLDMHGNPSGAPLQGQAVVYIGKNKTAFANNFKELCWIAEVAHV